jgi:hypothetical protein
MGYHGKQTMRKELWGEFMSVHTIRVWVYTCITYIHMQVWVRIRARGAGAESCDKMDRAGDYDERFLHDADKHFSWNSEADDVGHRSDFS